MKLQEIHRNTSKQKKELIENYGIKAILLFELKEKIDELQKRISNLQKRKEKIQGLKPINYDKIINLEHTLYYFEKKLEELIIKMNQITRNMSYDSLTALSYVIQTKQ